VAISAVDTVLLLIAISGAQRPVRLAARGAPPWPAPSDAVTGVRAAGLSLGSAAAAFVQTRYAVHVDVRFDGKPVIIPAGIGVSGRRRGVAPLYTSDASGIVHVVSAAQAPVFTLGQFFDEWQVPLTAATAYVNGTQVSGNPGAVVLAPHQEIAVSYGAGAGSGPARFEFPAGT
jgi:hypothetical protein